MKSPSFNQHGLLSTPDLHKFVSCYKNNPIVLYVGAGISVAARDKAIYGLPDWRGLLGRVAEKLHLADPANSPRIDPWTATDRLVRGCGGHNEPIQKALQEIVQNQANSRATQDKRFKLLTKEYLDRADTLRGVASFCTLPSGKPLGSKSYRFKPNPRVRAVISGNYDHYLEACATSMFRSEVLHPVGALGSHAGSLNQIPVFHIHGYVPHVNNRGDIDYKSLAGGLVLTRQDYAQAWKATSAFCHTMGIQTHLLRHYTTLFVGFSFTDKKINELLKHVHQESIEGRPGHERWHYAIMRRNDNWKATEERLKALGVCPLWVKDHSCVPVLLGMIQLEGLRKDHPAGTVSLPTYKPKQRNPLDMRHSLSADRIWPLLLSCRIATPRAEALVERDSITGDNFRQLS